MSKRVHDNAGNRGKKGEIWRAFLQDTIRVKQVFQIIKYQSLNIVKDCGNQVETETRRSEKQEIN